MPPIVSSYRSLASSIETDPFVLRWFTVLVIQPKIRLIVEQQSDLRRSYKVLKDNFSKQIFLYLLALAVLAFTLAQQQGKGLLLVLFLIYPWSRLLTAQRKEIKKLALYIIEQDFDERTFSQQTLYQWGEFYSRRYGIPSLVETIYAWDRFWRRALIAVSIGVVLTYYFFITSEKIRFWILAPGCAAIIYVLHILLRTIAFYSTLNQKTQAGQHK